MSSENQIRNVLAELSAAATAKDLDRLMKVYARDVVEYDLLPPLESTFDQLKNNWKMCFESSKAVRYDLERTQIIAEDDLGMVYGLVHFVTDTKDDEHVDTWSRFTAALRKTADGWKIIHAHDSVPIDMLTQKPLMDLKPGTMRA